MGLIELKMKSSVYPERSYNTTAERQTFHSGLTVCLRRKFNCLYLKKPKSIFGLSAEKLNVLTSLYFEDILAFPLVLVGIFGKYSEALKNPFMTKPTKMEELWIAATVRGKYIMWDQTLGDRKGWCTSMPTRPKRSQAVCKHAHTEHTYMWVHITYMHICTCIHGHHIAHRPLRHTQTAPLVSFCSHYCLSRLEAP